MLAKLIFRHSMSTDVICTTSSGEIGLPILDMDHE